MLSRVGLGCFRQVRDLLGKDHSKKMELKESPDRGVYVKDLSQFVCKNFDEMNKVLKVRAGWAAMRTSCLRLWRRLPTFRPFG